MTELRNVAAATQRTGPVGRSTAGMTEKLHRETLEEQTTHMGGEARMLLPGVQTILGFQLMAVFNQRFEQFGRSEQIMHYWAFLLTACTMALLMAPAAYHRQVERDRVTTRFITLSSWLLALSMLPFIGGMCLDTYLIGRLITHEPRVGLAAAIGMFCVLAGLWFGVPAVARRRRRE
jgi:hypothetical protein